mmetsp:Transcript_20214/g.40283  ORF Transcript_20214/g.40283 Transcript_20214/m.40283 type:complete len:303 (+) Transcript_20214:870-1778(+)
MTPAHPLPESSTSAYENPPTNASPLKSERETLPARRSTTATSHVSKPADTNAAHISRSPLLPSCRRTATLGFPSAAMTSSAVFLGAKESFQSGTFLCLSPSSSCLTHFGFRCLISSWKLVASHRSCRAVLLSSMHTLSPTEILIESPADTEPMSTQGTPAARYFFITEAVSLPATSRTSPASSLKSTSILFTSAMAGTVTSMAHFPANAISIRVTANPPSDLSCPARMVRASMSSCVVSNAALRMAKSSMSGDSSPTCPKTCASAVPPHLVFPAPRSMYNNLDPAGHLRSGVTVLVTSGHVT